MIGEKMLHSVYYHKRFEGWMEKVVEDGSGRKHIERVYTGDYFRQDVSDRRRCIIRIAYAVLYVLSAGCFLFVSARSTGSNRAFFNQFLCFLTLLPMVAIATLLVAEAMAVIIFLVLHRDNELLGELINFAGYLAASLAMFAMNRMETGIKYIKTPSGIEPLRGGYVID
jgi:hypothetical protein